VKSYYRGGGKKKKPSHPSTGVLKGEIRGLFKEEEMPFFQERGQKRKRPSYLYSFNGGKSLKGEFPEEICLRNTGRVP